MTNQHANDILTEAADLINGDRQQSYGPPTQSMTAIARLWEAYLDRPITAEQVAHMMSLLKISRAAQDGPKRDNYVDAAAYQAIAAQCAMPAKPTSIFDDISYKPAPSNTHTITPLASRSINADDYPGHILTFRNDGVRECIKCARTWAVGEQFLPKELCNEPSDEYRIKTVKWATPADNNPEANDA